MFFKKQGMPEPGELVICTVKKVLPHAAFVSLDEYNNLEAMLHVSEISSRWVKNIKEHVNEGKKIVCKVLEMHKERGHIDVSLKRVTNAKKTKKLNAEKTEIRMEKLIEIIAKKLKQDPKVALKEIGPKIIDYFGSLADFYDYVKKEGVKEIEELDIHDDWKKELMTQIDEQLKAIRVKVSREFEMRCFEPDGVNRINDFFTKMINFAKDKGIEIKTNYISAPQYSIDVIEKNYKEAEARLKEIFEQMDKVSKENRIELKYQEEN